MESLSLQLDPWLQYTVMCLCQILQSWFRAWNITSLATKSYVQAHISWQLYGWVWIVGLVLGVKAVTEGDPIGIFLFFLSGAIGLQISIWLKK